MHADRARLEVVVCYAHSEPTSNLTNDTAEHDGDENEND